MAPLIIARPMKAADIPADTVVAIVDDINRTENRWAMVWEIHPRLCEVMGQDVPWKVMMAKLRKLDLQDVLNGCACGCRGDFEVPGWHPR